MNKTLSPHIQIRPAYPDDNAAVWRLAALDSAPVPPEPLLLAEVDGQLRAAVSVTDLRAVADPFVPTAHIVDVVRHHIAGGEIRSADRRRQAIGARRQRRIPAAHLA
jgi:hypothetical protein